MAIIFLQYYISYLRLQIDVDLIQKFVSQNWDYIKGHISIYVCTNIYAYINIL